MNCIQKHLKKLSEEKLILAKEEGEGGGAPAGGGDGGGAGGEVAGGVVNAPSNDGGDGGVIPQGTEPPHTGLSTTDVLGKCDHRKDGVFGPGCFHLPCVWSIPCFRIPRKKRKKKLKFSNLVTEEDSLSLFIRDVKPVVEREMAKAQEWLMKIDPEIKLVYVDDYEFEGEKADWVAALDKDGQDDVKEFRVAFNLEALFEFLDQLGLDMDEVEIQVQVKVALWHEIGHALIDYFRDMEIYDFEVSGVKEEKLVEEFARYMIKRFSGVTRSELNDFVKDTFGTQDIKEDETVDETKGNIETDFTSPIKLSDTRRFVPKELASKTTRKFIVEGIQIPASAGLFAEQNGKDVEAAINRQGLLRLTVAIDAEDKDEKDFLALPKEDQVRFVDILRNVEKYSADPKDDFELDVASEFEAAPKDQRLALAERYEDLSRGGRELWYRPTLLDVVRICHVGGVNVMPLDVLAKLDENDHQKSKRYIESVNESAHRFVEDMYHLQRTRAHFASERWTLLKSDYSDDADLGTPLYVVRLLKRSGDGTGDSVGTNYIFSSGVLFGYDVNDRRLQTVYYIEPCEVVYMLSKGQTVDGDPQKVSMRLMWRCFQNLVQKKAFAGHQDRRQKD